jgi:hypothetical protein
MHGVIGDYWSILPYLTMLIFLAVMSIREKPTATDGEKTTG